MRALRDSEHQCPQSLGGVECLLLPRPPTHLQEARAEMLSKTHTFPFRTQSQAFKAAENRRVKANSLRGDRWTGTWCPAAMQLQCIRVYRSGDQSIDCQQSAVLKEIIRSGEQQ